MSTPSFDLFLTISGLYLVVVDGDREEQYADKADLLLPRISHHLPRLSFSIGTLQKPTPHPGIDHFLGADGIRFGSVPVGDEVEIRPTSDEPSLELFWDATSTTRSLREVLDVTQLGLALDEAQLERFPATRLTLDDGCLFAADVYRDPKNGKILHWSTGDPNGGGGTVEQHICDDVVLYRTGLTEPLVVDTGVERLQLEFLPEQTEVISPQRDAVHLCLSNDLADLRACSPPRSSATNWDTDSPFNHLGFLTALGLPGNQITIPKVLRSGQTPSGPRCNGLITFRPTS